MMKIHQEIAPSVEKVIDEIDEFYFMKVKSFYIHYSITIKNI